MKTKLLICLATMIAPLVSVASVVNVGKASYSEDFPGTDKAGRNGYPAGTPYVSGNAATRPVPTNDWWSNELIMPHASAIFNYPMALRPTDDGLVIINNMQGQAITAEMPFTVGVEGVTATYTTVSDYTDWTVTINWTSHSGDMNATVVLGTPMVYFTKSSPEPVRISVSTGNIVVDGNKVCVDGCYNRSSYVIYAPEGSTWTRTGSVLTSSLAGNDYWTVAMLPQGYDAQKGAAELADYAFVFPGDTRAEWDYDLTSGTVTTTYRVVPDVKEGSSSRFLMGLLPHHWGNLAGELPAIDRMTYNTVRGKLILVPGNEFTTRLTYHGVLPSLPLIDGGTGFDAVELKRLVNEVCNANGFDDWTDSYNDGQLLNRLVQTAAAAKGAGDTEGFSRAFNLVKAQLEKWLSFTPGDVAFMFYYHRPWNTMLGYPAGHGQDTNINDHNFHWGYFIRAAAFITQYDPEWANEWGAMIDLLVRDVASPDRDDNMFPYLRSFSPYAGHCWANGTASLSLGNDQESTSEAMQFNTALILWGDVTGNIALRDLGVYLYTTERSAIEEYWFDVHGRNRDASFTSALASRVFGNAYDDENFWGGGIAGSYGIQIYPVHAGSFYLMNDPGYAARLWDAMSKQTGILNNDSNPNIWYDTWLRFLAMWNATEALKLYSQCNHLGEKFGESQAHTYQWLHTMAAIGSPANDITADHPVAMAFNNDGYMTYIACNSADTPLSVSFTDGFKLDVQPHSMAFESTGTRSPKVTLSVDADRPVTGSTVTLTADVVIPDEIGERVTRIDFVADDAVIGTSAVAPYRIEWTPAEPGEVNLYAVLTTTSGRTVESLPVRVVVLRDGAPGDLACSFIGTQATEGSFTAPYHVMCRTIDGGVEVSATFEGVYDGFAGPWLFNETDGFTEIAMNDAGAGLYKAVLNGVSAGDIVRFRVKIAYSGSLGVTTQFQYEVGSYCEGAVTDAVFVPEILVTSGWNISAPVDSGEVILWDMTGRPVAKTNLKNGQAHIDASKFDSGTYLLSVYTPSWSRTVKLLNK